LFVLSSLAEKNKKKHTEEGCSFFDSPCTIIKSKRERKETQKIKEFKSSLTEQKKTDKKPGVKQNKPVATQEEMFIIESLLEKKGPTFLVKWENYNEDWNSWEPRNGIPQFIVQVMNDDN
jgi:hypothetical protein